MLVADFVKISSETMKLLSKFDIRTNDFRYVDMYADYEKMANRGDKISYIVTMLSDKYSVSEATVYRMLRRFKATI